MNKRRKTDRRNRKPPWILGGVVLLLLTGLFLLQSSNVWKNFTVVSAGDTLILYSLSSLNFIAFIIFAFILVRSLLKLRQERRTLQLGSKIKTRLLTYFVAVSILPLIAMAVFSYLFMNRAVERWFTQIPENVVNKSNEIRSQTNKKQIEMLRRIAPMLAETIGNASANDTDLQKIVDSGDLIFAQIQSNNGEILAEARKTLTPENEILLEAKLRESISRNESNRIEKFDVTTAKMTKDRTLLVVMEIPDSNEIKQIAKNSLVELDKLKTEDRFVRLMGISTLGLLTFLLIFASSWTAFYVGKNLTRPIRALAEGADEIAKGNLSHRVKTFAEDELELLVQAFNGMSAKLEESSVELSERRKYIETVLQSLSAGVVSFDADNRITTINKAAIKMFNFEDADFSEFELEQLINEDNQQILEKLIARAKRIGQATEQTNLRRENADGSASDEMLPVALMAAALPDGGGAVLVIEDLSELIAAQRASAWQEVARRMAHEIKNPLTPIQLSAERIAKQFRGQVSSVGDSIGTESPRSDGKTEKIINDGTETILREVSSLKSMVDEFSRYARLPKATLEEGELNRIIQQATLLYADRKDEIKIETNLARDIPKLLVDAEQLKRVFVNLIDNSCEAFEDGVGDRVINIKTYHDAARDLVVTEFSDNGKGIDPANIQNFFQPYFSTKGRGTGLGLAIVQRIVDEHGGKIKAVANKPKGAKFILEINVGG